jgi:hypothetical protein
MLFIRCLKRSYLRVRFVSHTKGRTQIEGVSEQGAEETFGPEREEVEGGMKRLHNEGFHNLYASQNIIRVFKSRRVR